MTILNKRNADIVKLNRVDGKSTRQVASETGVDCGTVSRVVGRFKRELAVFVGPLDTHTPDSLRAMTIAVLQRAETQRAA